jgi:E1-E2 ATPase/Cation transport ATPase (P-type)
MGTVVHAGTGLGVVVRTGPRTAFGQIALRLGQRHEQTAFQRGLRDFSGLLVRVTLVLAVSIFVINAVLGRSLLESGLFALAIAVGLTPQLLPAIVTISLSTGARRLAHAQVVVKRLVVIEDLGNIQVLCTDKTGTLTEGRIRFDAALDVGGAASGEVLRLGLLCNEAVISDGRVVAGNPLDRALWEAALAAAGGTGHATGGHATGSGRADQFGGARRLAIAPFDYERRLASVLVAEPDGRRMVVSKGAPEAVLARCSKPPAAATPFCFGSFLSRRSGVSWAHPSQGSPTRWSGGMSIASPPSQSTRQGPASTPDRNLPVGLARLVSADRRREHAIRATPGSGATGPQHCRPRGPDRRQAEGVRSPAGGPGVDRLVAGAIFEVALQHRRQRTVATEPWLQRGQCPPLPHRPGLPSGHPGRDHPEQTVRLGRRHPRAGQPVPPSGQQLGHELAGRPRPKPAGVAKRPGELGGQAVLGGPVEAVLGALERQGIGP